MSTPLKDSAVTPVASEVPRPLASDRPGSPDLALLHLVAFLRRHWLLILGTSVVTTLVTALFVRLFTDDTYEAVAVMVVAPAKFSSSLQPAALGVRDYRRLLESEGVLAETSIRLMEKGTLADGSSIRVGQNLESRLPVSTLAARNQPARQGPLMETVARAGSPQEAADIANVWAEVFVEYSQKLMVDSTAPTIDLIETEFHRRRAELEDLGRARIDLSNEYQKKLDRVELGWLRRIRAATTRWESDLVDTRTETEELVARYQTETRRTIETYAEAQGLSLATSVPAIVPTEGALAPGAELDPAVRLRQLVTLRIQLAQTPQMVLLEKTITDDALWQAAALGEMPASDLETMAGRTNLLTQEISPLHTELALGVSRLETSLVDERALRIASRLETLQRERGAGLAKTMAARTFEFDQVQTAREIELADLTKQKRQEIEAMERERNLRLEQIDQDLLSKRTVFATVAENKEQAILVQADQNLADINLSWPAVPPMRALPKGLASKALIAAVLGALAGLTLALVLEAKTRLSLSGLYAGE